MITPETNEEVSHHTTIFVSSMPSPGVLHKRKKHSKVTTGCHTCKLRRKKCDETRPRCRRCTDSGRECSGYPCDPLPWTTQWNSQALIRRSNTKGDSMLLNSPVIESAIRPLRTVPHNEVSQMQQANLTIRRNPLSRPMLSDLERSCLEFFLERTGPEISGYFGSSFWSGPILCSFIGNDDITVRAAMIAVGAAHRLHELDITPRAFEFCELARSSYTKALRAFNFSLNRGVTAHLMVLPLLFYIYELFQDNVETARMHMSGWLKNLFSLGLQKTSVRVERHYDTATDESIYAMFQRIEEATTLLLPRCCSPSHPKKESTYRYKANTPFLTLDEACSKLFCLIRTYTEATKSHPTLEVKGKAREDCAIALLSWSCSFAEYVKSVRWCSTPVIEQAATALRIYRDTGCLLLLTHSHNSSDGAFKRSQEVEIQAKQTINAHFARIKDRVGNLLVGNDVYGNLGRRPSLVVDSGTFHPYLYESRALGSVNLRHQLVKMIGEDLSRCLEWQKRGAYGVAERIANIEEGLVLALSARTPQLQPINMDVVLYMEGKKLLVRQCVADPADGALVCTQQWYVF